MALFGSLLRGISPLASFIPKGTGAAIGQQISNAGSALHLPELGISEKFAGYTQAPQTHASTGGQVQGLNTQRVDIPTGIATAQAPGGGSYNTGGAAPATGGQAPSGGGGGGIAPDQQYLQQLRDSYNGVRQGYQNQIGSYDSDYNNQKAASDASIAAARDTATQQDAQDEKLYGQNLKSLLQSNNELNQRRQGTFSALGTLDSSQYMQDTAKGDQQLLDNQQSLVGARDQSHHDRESQLNAYVNDTNTKLGAYANEISRAKEGLQQAISNTDMNQANSIQQYIGGLQQQAQQLQQQQQAMQLNLAQLAAQGVDVQGNLAKTNLGGFSNQFGSQIQNQLTSGLNRYSTPSSNAVGQGYINPYTGKALTDDEKRQLLALNQ